MDELAVRIIEGSARMDSHDKEAQRFAVFAQPYRYDARLFRRAGPIGHGHTRCAIAKFDNNPIPRQCWIESPKVLAVAVDDWRTQNFVGFYARHPPDTLDVRKADTHIEM